jgi:hypothetical protein
MLLLALLVAAAAESEPQKILLERCVACHGPDVQKGDLRLDRPLSAARVLAPGDPEDSELYRRLVSDDPDERMPKGKPALPPEELEILRRWIAAGAQWPEESAHWAYRAPGAVDPPPVRAAAWVRNPIDAFVLARLEQAGLEPAPEADRRTLLRRLALDLVGLPPKPEEAREFAADESAGAYERAVERLLASPHFGERWALPWLDLARYADTNGYEKDARRSNWPWRDWVIDALNADMPFDRFTIEQLAGDLLPEASTSQRIATGFQRNSLVNQEGGTDPEEFRFAAVVDRTNTAATVWLGSTLGCAQCHNHKYDPFTQRDYYRMLAFFDQSADTGNAVEPLLPVPAAEMQRRRAELEQRVQELQRRPAQQPPFDAVDGWEIAGPYSGDVPAQPEWRPETGRERGAVRPITEQQASWLWQRSFRVEIPQRVALSLGADDELRVTLDEHVVYENTHWDPVMKDAHRVVLDLTPGEHRLELRVRNGGGPGGLYFDCAGDGELVAAQAELAALAADVPTTMVMQERSDKRTTHLHVKGAFLQLGEEVTPDTPACLPPMDPAWPKNRLGLALCLVDPRNPLVARVQVNRVWEQLFGRGLVATGEDFGTRGAVPSHRELLDWLAGEYVRGRWSLKQLLRTIVGSATYRQAALSDARRLEIDPDDALLSRSPRGRLPAELLRDNALAIAGLLDPHLGGASVFPPQPDGIWAPVYSDDKWMESRAGERVRRGLYTFWRRSSPYASFMLFDAPSREGCCARRARSDTPLQALALLNDPAFVECARALGQRMQAAPGELRQRLALGFERCTARCPEPRELDALAALLEAQGQPGGWTAVANVLLNLDETLCRP